MDGATLCTLPKGSHRTNIIDRLDSLPWTRWHYKLLFTLGFGWAFDAFEITFITSTLPTIQRYFSLSAQQVTLLTTLWHIGAMVGAIGFGYITDRFGRKFSFVVTILFYCIMSLIAAFSPSFEFLLAFRFLTAIGVGAEYAVINATIVELVPYRFRGGANAAVMSFWFIGALLAHGLQIPILSQLNDFWSWRVGFLIASGAAFFIVFMRWYLVESPRWLLEQNQFKKAEEVMNFIEFDCGMKDTQQVNLPRNINYHPHPRYSFFRIFKDLITIYPGFTLLASILNLSQAFSDYGVSNILSVSILPDHGVTGSNLALFFLYGVLGTLPAFLLIIFTIDKLGRKILLPINYTLCIAAVACFIPVINSDRSLPSLIGMHCFYQFAYTLVMATVYPTISELFPTYIRASGIGFSVALGRIAAAIAPKLLVWVYEVSEGSFVLISVTIICFLSLGWLTSIIWFFNGVDGKYKSLEDIPNKMEVIAGEDIGLNTL